MWSSKREVRENGLSCTHIEELNFYSYFVNLLTDLDEIQ